jgi:hypothetical protein
LGFAGASRRSELVALNVADLEETEDGLKITIRRSKTDQEGHGETIAIVRGGVACPVKAVKAWMQAAAITEGPLFRPVAKGGRLGVQRLTGKSVCDLVKAYAAQLGFKAGRFPPRHQGEAVGSATGDASCSVRRSCDRLNRDLAIAQGHNTRTLKRRARTGRPECTSTHRTVWHGNQNANPDFQLSYSR